MKKAIFVLAFLAFLTAANIAFANTNNQQADNQDNNNWLKTGGFSWDVKPWLSRDWFSPKGNWDYKWDWDRKCEWEHKKDWDYKDDCHKPCKPHCPVTPEPISSILFLLGGGALLAARKARRK
jgi:hypothetical protein